MSVGQPAEAPKAAPPSANPEKRACAERTVIRTFYPASAVAGLLCE
jgi:hypothetical protein